MPNQNYLKKLVCFGNSLTQGYLVPPHKSWPSLLANMAAIKTFNYGIAGDTTQSALKRLKKIDNKADGAFVELGINDFLSGMPIQTTFENLKIICNTFLNQNMQVILAGFRLDGFDTEKWEQAYESLSTQLNIPLYKNIFKGLEKRNDCFLPDNIHPNSKGYKIIAENIHDFLIKNRMLPSLQPIPSSEELVMIVDKQNKPIDAVPRYKMRKEKLIHRATYILLFNSKGEIFVHKRTASKDIYPSHYDIAAGGIVLAGEAWQEAAERELFEELGVKNIPLEYKFEFYLADEKNRVWGRVYTCKWDGPLVLQKEEVEKGLFLPVDKVFEMAKNKPFCPDGIYVLNRLFKN